MEKMCLIIHFHISKAIKLLAIWTNMLNLGSWHMVLGIGKL